MHTHTHRHLITPSGVYLTFPPVQLPREFHPMRTEWYTLSAPHKGALTITTPRLLDEGLVYSVGYTLRAPGEERWAQSRILFDTCCQFLTHLHVHVAVNNTFLSPFHSLSHLHPISSPISIPFPLLSPFHSLFHLNSLSHLHSTPSPVSIPFSLFSIPLHLPSPFHSLSCLHSTPSPVSISLHLLSPFHSLSSPFHSISHLHSIPFPLPSPFPILSPFHSISCLHSIPSSDLDLSDGGHVLSVVAADISFASLETFLADALPLCKQNDIRYPLCRNTLTHTDTHTQTHTHTHTWYLLIPLMHETLFLLLHTAIPDVSNKTAHSPPLQLFHNRRPW